MRKVLNFLHLSSLELSAKVRYVVEKLSFQLSLSLPPGLLYLTLRCCFSWFQASIRRSAAYLIGYFFKNSKLYLVDEAPNMISTLIVLLSDSDSATVAVCAVHISSSVVISYTEHFI